MKRLLMVMAFSLTLVSGLSAESSPTTLSTQALQTAQGYQDSEFSPWVLKIRRAEIIAIGAFPLVYLFSGLGYDYYYYASSGFSQTYIPWPAGQGTSQWTTSYHSDLLQQKNLTLIGASLGISVLLAGVDWLLGL